MSMIIGRIGDDLVRPRHRAIELCLRERDPFGGLQFLKDSRLDVIERRDETQHARWRPCDRVIADDAGYVGDGCVLDDTDSSLIEIRDLHAAVPRDIAPSGRFFSVYA